MALNYLQKEIKRAQKKKLPAWRIADLKKKEIRLRRRMKATGEIELLYYKTIEKGFFEVFATTWQEKISFEGNMCGGLLKKFIKEVISGGGQVKKVKYALVEHEAKEELKQVSAELRGLQTRVNTAMKTLKSRN
jgi:Zn-dependent M16 (insulinase) family peptidase